MEYFVYILGSQVKVTYYTGISNNPKKRLFFHNNGSEGHTKRYRPWKLVFTKGYQTKEEAMTAEQKIKGWKSKRMIRLLIQGKITLEG